MVCGLYSLKPNVRNLVICDDNEESLLVTLPCTVELVNVIKIFSFSTVTFNGEACLLENTKVANLLSVMHRLYGIHTTYVREGGYWHSNHASKCEPHFAARAG